MLIVDHREVKGFIKSRVYQIKGLSNRGFIKSRVYQIEGLSNQGFIKSRVYQIKGLSNQGFIKSRVYRKDEKENILLVRTTSCTIYEEKINCAKEKLLCCVDSKLG